MQRMKWVAHHFTLQHRDLGGPWIYCRQEVGCQGKEFENPNLKCGQSTQVLEGLLVTVTISPVCCLLKRGMQEMCNENGDCTTKGNIWRDGGVYDGLS